MDSYRKELVRQYITPGNPVSFASPSTVKKYFKKLSIKEIQYILSKIESYTLHKQYKELKRNPTFIYNLRKQFQIDLAFLGNLSQHNDGMKYLLNCIDSFSRFAFVRPLKDKKSSTFLEAFNSILEQAKIKPKTILSDRGTEMNNQLFSSFCIKNNIKFLNNYTSIHANIVERFNYTIKSLMHKFMTQTNQSRYIDELQNIVQSYNLRVHRSIGMTPYEAEIPSNSYIVRSNLIKMFHSVKEKLPKFKVGQTVRISLEKTKFKRGFTEKSTREIFIISKIKTNLPIPLYFLKDEKNEPIIGGFYEFELSPVNK